MPTKVRVALVERNTGVLVAKGKEAVVRIEREAYPLAPLSITGQMERRAIRAWLNAPLNFRSTHVLYVYRERRRGRSMYKRVLRRTFEHMTWRIVANGPTT